MMNPILPTTTRFLSILLFQYPPLTFSCTLFWNNFPKNDFLSVNTDYSKKSIFSQDNDLTKLPLSVCLHVFLSFFSENGVYFRNSWNDIFLVS